MTPHATERRGSSDPRGPLGPGGPLGRIGRVLLALTLGCAVAIFFEGLASVVIAAREARWQRHRIAEESHSQYDPDLGWRHIPGIRREDLYGPGRSLTIDARGFRGTQGFEDAVPPGRYRVVCLGDSFTQGYGVDDAETFPAQLAERCTALECVNMGMGGYGLDQDYLWYLRDGATFAADLVLFTFIVSDFDRMGRDAFMGDFPKPVLALEDGELVARNVPVPHRWPGEAGLRSLASGFVEGLATRRLIERIRGTETRPRAPEPWSRDPMRPVAEALFRELARLATERGARLALCYVPIRTLGRWPDHEERLAWMRETAAAVGAPFVDASEVFGALSATEIDTHYFPDSHLTPLGNARLAELLLRELGRALPAFPCR